MRGAEAGINRARLWRSPNVPGVELFDAAYTRHAFGRHVHSTLAIGVVDGGRGEFWCRGKTHGVPADSLVLIGPGEPHTGGLPKDTPPNVPLVYRMLYVCPTLAEEITGVRASDWVFTSPGPGDRALAISIRAAFDALRLGVDRLAEEARLASLLLELRRCYTQSRMMPIGGAGRRESRAITRVKEFLHAHPEQNVSLRDLGELAGLNPTYLNRAFRHAVGLPPHAYRIQLRVDRARELLGQGIPAATVAQMVGFSDQSKLTRHFGRAVGIPPARYQAGTLG